MKKQLYIGLSLVSPAVLAHPGPAHSHTFGESAFLIALVSLVAVGVVAVLRKTSDKRSRQ